MKDRIQLIVGLGNPGEQYSKTRHNAGADFVEQLADSLNSPLRNEKRFSGRYARATMNGEALHLLIPTTFMNLSGQSVQALANFYKISPENILVVHDELDLPPGQARFKKGGGHGGHNGLRDIINKLGNQNSFYRLRIGIGHPGNAQMVAGYVLTKAPASESTATESACYEAHHTITLAICGDWAKAMNRLHSYSYTQ